MKNAFVLPFTVLVCSAMLVTRGATDNAPAKPAKPKQQYTCPMDPEVVQDHPGICPKCGMRLVPKK